MSRAHQLKAQLSSLHVSGKRIIYLITEDRDILEEVFVSAAAVVKSLAPGMFTECKAPLGKTYTWVCSRKRLRDIYPDLQSTRHVEALFLDRADSNPLEPPKPVNEAFYYLNDFHSVLDGRGDAAKLLKQFLRYAREREECGNPVYLFLIAPVLQLPDGFLDEVEIIDLPELSEEELRELLVCKADPPAPDTQLDRRRIAQAVQDLKGLSRKQVELIVNSLQSSKGCFYGRSDTPCGEKAQYEAICRRRAELAGQAKRQAAQYDSTITLLEPSDSIAGMGAYCDWLDEVGSDLLHPESAFRAGVRPPKGVLLTGVPGSGKTQAAKKTAARMGVSLVQLRMDNLLGGLVGDSEANFKRCRKRVEALAPCVVLIDEMEKIFGTESGQGNHEVKMNLLAALLDWLQENTKPVFFFATSNSVESLRPELLRDGRFDRRFSVFMPSHDEMVEIFSFHMRQANRLSGGQLFQSFSQEYASLAREFLAASTQYAKDNSLDLFYTGANIENLVTQANRVLRLRRRKQPVAAGVSRGEYLQALMQTIQSGQSQPYGVTNMEDIAKFWVSALKNQYISASRQDLFPFQSFDRKQGTFFGRTCANSYDQHMFERISAEISALYRQSMENGKGRQTK